ncbi:MAG TPA: hypothetical protein VNA89_05760 [Gemmatimonadaceae bacterium]|nr:hypothetical protein [Gemmatimonadaceae bacterium]
MPSHLTTAVGRKTPRDGRLEIDASAALPYVDVAASPSVTLDGRPVAGTVERMPCSCGKGGPGHAHYFLRSAAFTGLEPGTSLHLVFDTGCIAVTRG